MYGIRKRIADALAIGIAMRAVCQIATAAVGSLFFVENHFGDFLFLNKMILKQKLMILMLKIKVNYCVSITNRAQFLKTIYAYYIFLFFMLKTLIHNINAILYYIKYLFY